MLNALGVDLGPAITPTSVLLTLPNGRKNYAEIDLNGPPAGLSFSLYYLEPGCTGDAYVSFSFTNELVPATLVTRAGAWALRPNTTQIRRVRSFQNVDDSGVGTCVAANFDAFTSRFDAYTLDQLGLIAPFSVQ